MIFSSLWSSADEVEPKELIKVGQLFVRKLVGGEILLTPDIEDARKFDRHDLVEAIRFLTNGTILLWKNGAPLYSDISEKETTHPQPIKWANKKNKRTNSSSSLPPPRSVK